MSVSTWVIVPAFNEASVIGDVLKDILALNVTCVVVDDGSSDETETVAKQYPVHYLKHKINRGQGAALQTGIRYALSKGAEVLVTFDADGQMDPRDIPIFTEALKKGPYDAVLGSRFKTEETASIPFFRHLVLKAAVAFTRFTTGLSVTDAHNGLRAFRRETAEKLNLQDGMGHASEILEQLADHNSTFIEVPTRISYSPYSLKKGQRSLNALNILWELLFK